MNATALRKNTATLAETTTTVPTLLTQAEAARLLGKSEKWFERDRWSGPTIPYAKLGRTVRYRAEDLLAYIEGNTVGAAQ